MSDSEGEDNGGLSGFLFGNLDENNQLEADYLDADVREQLQNLRGNKLGLSAPLEEIKEEKSKSKKKAALDHTSLNEKAKDAINFEDEEDLIDFTPQQNGNSMEDSLGDAEAPVAKEEASRPSKEFRLPAEKPILAKDGSNILLRFSQLFAEAGEAIRWHSNIVARSLVGKQSESLDEEVILRNDMYDETLEPISESTSDGEGDADENNETVIRDNSAEGVKQGGIEVQTSEQNRKEIEDTSKRKEDTATKPNRTFSIAPVELAEWEDRIYWGDIDAASAELLPEEEESCRRDDDSGYPEPMLKENAIEVGQYAPASEQIDNVLGILPQENVWIGQRGWEEDVRWDLEDDTHDQTVVHLDMNDPRLIFQLLQQNQESDDVDRAAAMILPPPPKVKIVGAPPVGKGRVYTILARQNVSQDEEYAKRKAKKGTLGAFKHRHAVPAMQLATLPPRILDHDEAVHRPRGLWLPLPSKSRARIKEGDRSTVKLISLVGHPKYASRGTFKADLVATKLSGLWQELIKGNKFADCQILTASQFDLWYRGAKPHPLDREIFLAETGAPQDANMEISVVVYGMQPLPSSIAKSIPDSLRNTPIPVAYQGGDCTASLWGGISCNKGLGIYEIALQKTKQLTASDGHVLLLEYLEETPLLLSRPGMVVRTCTYYRRSTPEDTGHETLLEEGWKVGSIESLQPNEEAPFMLGDVQPGKSQLSIESNMYRSIACAHATQSTDFLVIRSASGALIVREITGCMAVGQQEPLRRIPIPHSKECRELEENRMVAHVMRELRRQKIRLEKKRRGDDAMLETPPTITVRELVDLFPGISEGILRSRLKDRCSCISYKDDSAGTYRLAEGVAIADERELRQLARPEEWCTHESMTAALHRLSLHGISKYDRLAAIPIERLRICVEQLSPPEMYGTAASQLELLIQLTPWGLTDNFISALRENRGSLALTGPGDPTSRGDGFSYLKESIKSSTAKTVDASAVKEGNITGTNKDLRRLSMVESKNLLLKLGLSEDDIKGLGRWQRIAAVRDLSTAAAGEEMGELGKIGTRYARLAKSSSEEQSRARRIQASQIFERQVAALQDDGGEVSDDESWGGELEKELEGGEVEPVKKAKGEDDEDEMEDVEELRKGGFLTAGDDTSPLIKGKPKLEAKPGERRIKRTIVFMGTDGSRQTRTIIYTDKDKMQALNDLYRRADGKDTHGFGKRTISGGGTWLIGDEDGQPGRAKTKKNMSKIRCKACGQMGHYKSNKLCPLYEETHDKQMKAKKEAASKADDEKPLAPLKITLPSSPVKRKLSMQMSDSFKKGRFDTLSPTAGSLKKQLGSRVLIKAVNQAKIVVPEQFWTPFKMAVTKASAPDYNDFVPSSQEMHLDKIERKVKNGKYQSGKEFLFDCKKIADNAAIYNAAGNGKFGGPALVGWAESLYTAIHAELQSEALSPLLSEIEEAIKIEETEKAAAAEEVASQPVIEPPVTEEAPVIWVQCTRCQKWRKISQKVNDETVPTTQDGAWHCDWDFERPNASCDLPDDELADQ